MIAGSYFGGMSAGVKTVLWEMPSLRKELKQIISQTQGGYSNPTGLYFCYQMSKFGGEKGLLMAMQEDKWLRALKTPNSLKAFSKAPF